jgi:hypothetical protein
MSSPLQKLMTIISKPTSAHWSIASRTTSGLVEVR